MRQLSGLVIIVDDSSATGATHLSVSIYYESTRATPLSDSESLAINAILDEFSVDDQIEAYLTSGTGFNWESFSVYDRAQPTKQGVIFEGATKLPDNAEDAIWIGVQHWCKAISAIRRILPDADWVVHVDDHQIQWDEAANEYDPSV